MTSFFKKKKKLKTARLTEIHLNGLKNQIYKVT